MILAVVVVSWKMLLFAHAVSKIIQTIRKTNETNIMLTTLTALIDISHSVFLFFSRMESFSDMTTKTIIWIIVMRNELFKSFDINFSVHRDFKTRYLGYCWPYELLHMREMKIQKTHSDSDKIEKKYSKSHLSFGCVVRPVIMLIAMKS